MKSNRVHPSRSKRSRSPSQESFDSTLTFDRETGCCEGGCQRWCTQRCVCLIFICLLVVAVVAVAVALGVVYGVPKISGVNRECQTTLNQSGFLCDDRITCISPSKVCNQRSDCTGGADESTQYCSDPANTLPSSIIFLCGDGKTWTYTDKLCDMHNDCGDCSDETASQCPVCGGWRCATVFFQDCDCIPTTRCNDSVQDCVNWSDELLC
ncbi:low-density lipoprotein receptor class A domain-containing protein 1 [Lampetra fluviatilis]